MELQAYEREHVAALRAVLPECAVLLRSNGDFPLSGPCAVALYGGGARRTVKGGTGSGEVNSRYFHTVEDGLEKAGFTITTKGWLDAYDRVVALAAENFRKKLKERAREQHVNVMMLALGAAVPEPEYTIPMTGEGDVAIYVLSRNSGEGADRKAEKGDVLLTQTEVRDIKQLMCRYKKFLLVLNVGGAVDLTPVMEVPNILLLSQLGVETGDALADMVLGKANPSGKLATTWAAWESYPELAEFGGYDDTRYKEGIYVGYRWFDTVGGEPLFPFGYGLSYTTFTLGKPKVAVDKTKVAVTVDVENTGAHPGKEVVQLYVSVPAGKLDQPRQMLCAWVKTTELKPGEKGTFTASFDLTEISSYDPEAAAYILEGGDYILQVGTHSRNTAAAAALRLGETVTVRKVKNALGKPDFADFVPEKKEFETGLPVIEVDPAAFETVTVDYDFDYPVDPKAAALSDEDLVLLSNGAVSSGGMLSMIGNASATVCGAAGETAHVAGFPTIVMADGPAGVRISKEYFEDAKGKHGMEPPLPQSMLENLPAPVKFFMGLVTKKPRDPSQIRYQYCTAIPIGTALAQSWDPAVGELCGDIVGDEMERFNVDLWLAPALNIHRSILCGRDFEYFSEDPLISGKMAAAITRGVQKHPGKGVTIKHYAANNQEFNRTSNNSLVSERAMREIYLKGFEICVRESAPKAVMTSYNLINGQHTSTRRDLIEDILRREFGFGGIVMTDWVVMGGMQPKDAKYPSPDAGDVAAAGGDLFMPGSKGDQEKVAKALKSGRLTRRQLEINATRLLRCWDK